MITRDDFEDLLNEDSEQVAVCGHWFSRGTILRRCDPELFNIEYHAYCHAVEEAIDEENAQ